MLRLPLESDAANNGQSSPIRATLPFHATPESRREDLRADHRKIFFRAPPASHRMVIWPGDDVGKHKGENLREVFRVSLLARKEEPLGAIVAN